jgi:hypothetical protein
VVLYADRTKAQSPSWQRVRCDVYSARTTAWKEQLLSGAAAVLGGGAPAESGAGMENLHAKIGGLAYDTNCLEHALSQAGLLSANDDRPDASAFDRPASSRDGDQSLECATWPAH